MSSLSIGLRAMLGRRDFRGASPPGHVGPPPPHARQPAPGAPDPCAGTPPPVAAAPPATFDPPPPAPGRGALASGGPRSVSLPGRAVGEHGPPLRPVPSGHAARTLGTTPGTARPPE